MKTTFTKLIGRVKRTKIAKVAVIALALTSIDKPAKALIGNSELNLKMFDNANFWVVLDNNKFQQFDNTFSLGNILPGRHYLKVIKFPAMYGYHATKAPKVVFEGFVRVPAGSKVFAMIDKFRCFTVTNIMPIGGGHCGTTNFGDADYFDYGDDDACGSMTDFGGNGGFGGGITTTQCATPVPVIVPMQPNMFAQLKNTIYNSPFDSGKLITVKQALGTNYVTTAQILELMKMFSFESTRLDFAKFAYNKCVDRNNYFVINNGFFYQSSISTLNNFIGM